MGEETGMTDLYVIRVCLAFALAYHNDPADRRVANSTCLAVAKEAKSQGVDRAGAIALAFAESRFLPQVTSSKGARGPLQVIPKWHCPKQGECDYIHAGVSALKTFMRLFPSSFADAVCHYNSGLDKICPEKSVSFALYVDNLRQKVESGKIR